MTKLWLKHCEGGGGAPATAGGAPPLMDLSALTRSGGVAPTSENDDATGQRHALQRLAPAVAAAGGGGGGGGGAPQSSAAGALQPGWCPPAKRNSSALSVFTDDEFAGAAAGAPPPRVPLLDGLRVAGLQTEAERRRENTGATRAARARAHAALA
jgi:hypothetical protein